MGIDIFAWKLIRMGFPERVCKAEEKKLFAYEMIVPKDHIWRARVDLSRIPEDDRGAVENQLRNLMTLGLYEISLMTLVSLRPPYI